MRFENALISVNDDQLQLAMLELWQQAEYIASLVIFHFTVDFSTYRCV